METSKKIIKRKAFTLVELVIVIAVIAILAGVMIPTFGGIITSSQVAADQATASAMNTNLAMNNAVLSESDLARIISDYTSLTPKSAEKGYHFWYDVSTGMVVLDTYENIKNAKASESASIISDESYVSSVSYVDTKEAANIFVEREKHNAKMFSNNDANRYFFLLDNGGTIGNAFGALYGTNSTTFKDATDKLAQVKDSAFNPNNEFAGVLNDRLASTYAVAVEKSEQINQPEVAQHVYIPYGVTELKSTTSKLNENIIFISIPDTVNEYLPNDSSDKAIKSGSIIDAVAQNIVAYNDGKADEEKISLSLPNVDANDVEKILGISTTGIEINFTASVSGAIDLEVLEDGKTNVVIKVESLDITVTFEPKYEYEQQVYSFDIKAYVEQAAGKLYIDGNRDDEKNLINVTDIYVREDHIASLKLEAYNFKGEDGSDINAVNIPMTWVATNKMVDISNGTVTIDPSKDTANTAVITATSVAGAENKNQVINVHVVRGAGFVTNFGSNTNNNNDITVTTASMKTQTLEVGFSHNFASSSDIWGDGKIVSDASFDITNLVTDGVTVTKSDATNSITIDAGTDLSGTASFTISATIFGETYTKNYSFSFVNATESPVVSKLNNEMIYRIGNKNKITLGDLLKVNDKPGLATAKSVTATVKDVTGANKTVVSSTVTSKTNWADTEITFTGTGYASITATIENSVDKKFTLTIYVEVVDGYNVRSYADLLTYKSQKNYVLLNDVKMTDDQYALTDETLYGNGYTFDVTAGGYTGHANNSTANYLINIKNSVLDNVNVVGAVYKTYGIYAADDYARAAVRMEGNSKILNSCISNCAAPIRVAATGEQYVTIANTTVRGGSYANIDISGGNITLDNVTTINQVNGNDKAADGTVVIGLGIAINYEGNGATITVKNGLKQYNYISKPQAEKYVTGEYGDAAVSCIFDNSQLANYRYTDANGDVWANMGIVSLKEGVALTAIPGIDAYTKLDAVSFEFNYNGLPVTAKGGFATFKPDADKISASAPAWTPAQTPTEPSYKFTFAGDEYSSPDGEGDKEYCYESNGKLVIAFLYGGSKTWNPNVFTFTKYGVDSSSVTIKMDGQVVTGNIVFNSSNTGNHTITYTYVDRMHQVIGDDGNLKYVNVTYTQTLNVQVTESQPNQKNATFMFGGVEAEKVLIDGVWYISAKAGSTKANTVGGVTINAPIVAGEAYRNSGLLNIAFKWRAYFPVFKGGFEITDYAGGLASGAATTYNASTTTLPAGLRLVTATPSVFVYGNKAENVPTDGPIVGDNTLYYRSPQFDQSNKDRGAYAGFVEYIYTDNAGTEYHYFIYYNCAAISATKSLTKKSWVS